MFFPFKIPDYVKAYATVIGGVLINLSTGTLYTFGNMSPYVTSYLRHTSEPTLSYATTMWVFASTVMGQGATLWIGGLLHRKIGLRPTMFIGSLFFCLGVLLSYYSIQRSFVAFIFTYGVMFGLGMGPSYTNLLGSAMKWFPSHKGLISGVIVAGFGAGSVIFDQVQTAFINPENFVANITEHNEKFFGQEPLLHRVPNVFLLLGGIYTTMHIVGILLISEPAEEHGEPSDRTSLINRESDIEPDITDKSPNVEDVHPLELVKSVEFWKLWFLFFFNLQSPFFISSLYKSYGETFISNDHFLAIVGSFAAVFNGGGRIFWGALIDRYRYKYVLIGQSLVSVVLYSTFSLTKSAGSAMYFIWVCLMFGTFSGNFAMFPTIMNRVFGAKYFTINFGLLFSSQIIAGPVSVLLTQGLDQQLGWSGLFLMVAVFSFIGFLLVLSLKKGGRVS